MHSTDQIQPAIVPCPRCQREPVAQKVGSYWHFHCPQHTGLMRVIGHRMGTKAKALEQWNIEMKATP